jgi:hypothetical protein
MTTAAAATIAAAATSAPGGETNASNPTNPLANSNLLNM